MNRTETYQPIKKEFIPLEKNQEVEVSVLGLREILQSTEEESDIPTSTGKTKNGIVPVPIIINGTNTHNSGDVAKQGSVRANLLGIIPFAKKLFSKKESQQMAVAPKPLPEGELVISFYDTSKVLLEEKTLKLSEINSWETLSFSTKAEEKGYVSAKIQGTSSEPVKFDDFSIQLKSLYSAKLYQENHYYPFGMNMKGLESQDEQTTQNKKEHEFQFNAQTEREESFGLFWDETPFRNYDSQLVRLWGVDKLAELVPGITPFHYAYNNPIGFNDPTGLMPQFDMPDYTPPPLGPSTLSPLEWHRRGVDIRSRFPNRRPGFAGQKEAGQSQASDTDPPPGTEELAEENAVTATRLGGSGASFTGIPRGMGALTPPMGLVDWLKRKKEHSESSWMRAIIPDMLFGDLGGDFYGGGGASYSPIGVALMLSGQDADNAVLYNDYGTGLGWDPGSAGMTLGAGWYIPGSNNLPLSIDNHVAGPRTVLDFGWKNSLELSFTASITHPTHSGDGRILSLGVSFGVSDPLNPALLGGSLNHGTTNIYSRGKPSNIIPLFFQKIKSFTNDN